MSDILPSEIWTEILVRLPVRSLLSLKCVSKSFLSFIQNPNFTHLHFSRSNNSSAELDESDLFLLERSASFTVCRGNKFSKTLEFAISIDSDYDVVGYVDGLLWLNRFNSNIEHMLFCNPSIRKCLLISPSPACHLGKMDLGFGYDRVSNDYKTVVIVHVGYDEYHSQFYNQTLVEVYSVKMGSWRRIEVDLIIGDWVLGKSVYANGAVHWLAASASSYSYGDDFLRSKERFFTHVVSFDLSTEVFSFRELPKLDGSDLQRIMKLPLSLKGSFAVLYAGICVWIMEENGWSKEQILESLSLYQYLYNDYNRIDQVNNAIFCEKSGEVLISTDKEGLISYNSKTRTYNTCHYCVAFVDRYVESLLWTELLPTSHDITRSQV